MKADAVYDRPFWRAEGLTGLGVSDRGAVRVAFDNGPADARVGVLLAFIGGSTWERYGVLPRPALRKAVLDGFATMFGPRALEPIEYVEHDWTHERWARGGPVALLGPGTSPPSAHHPAAVRPGPLGRHGDVDVLGGLPGRSGPSRRPRGARGAGGAVRARITAVLAAPALVMSTTSAPGSAAEATSHGAEPCRPRRRRGRARRPACRRP